jgi:hypothetical protein
MAKTKKPAAPARFLRVEQYADLEDTLRPPYFGEREPVVHIVDEKIHLTWSPYAIYQLALEAARRARASIKIGRPPKLTAAMAEAARSDLKAWVQAGGNEEAKLRHVQAYLKERGVSVKPSTIQRKILWD